MADRSVDERVDARLSKLKHNLENFPYLSDDAARVPFLLGYLREEMRRRVELADRVNVLTDGLIEVKSNLDPDADEAVCGLIDGLLKGVV